MKSKFIKINNNKYYNDLVDELSIEGIKDMRSICDEILKESNTMILLISNSLNNTYNHLISKESKDINNKINDSVKELFNNSRPFNINSNILESNGLKSQIGENIFFYKFDSIDDLNGFTKIIQKDFSDVEFFIYTTLEENCKCCCIKC